MQHNDGFERSIKRKHLEEQEDWVSSSQLPNTHLIGKGKDPISSLVVTEDRSIVVNSSSSTGIDVCDALPITRPKKRALGIHNSKTGSNCNGSDCSGHINSHNLVQTAVEKNEIPTKISGQGTVELSQPCLRDSRTVGTSQLPNTHLIGKGKDPISSLVVTEDRSIVVNSSSSMGIDVCNALPITRPKKRALGIHNSKTGSNRNGSDCSGHINSHNLVHDERRPFCNSPDITKGSEKVKISLVYENSSESLPKFNYIPHNIIYEHANVNISLARIVDEDCCSGCSGDCLSSSIPCACARETGGEFAYTPKGLLKEEFLSACASMKKEPQERHFVYCQDCPLERTKNELMPEQCKGHLVRKFIKECWRKCGCDMSCGNRIVQRGITSKLQVFWTLEGKGWGLRTLEDLPKGSFVCEYIGEVLTNMELYDRVLQSSGNERHTYPVTLDADWGSEGVLRDEEALCLDATCHGNVARFINHRCFDANLVDIPVEVETPDRHYYHLAFFTTRKVSAFEELSWDYGIDFADQNHPVKAFRCCCGSAYCREMKQKRS
ncbi:histone-lysine N-methyltransferase SUVR4 isoform X3 [Alnus glutinosa]|nr:histone-lysine N-methyltransferase SUVR4 isoform X3 [Alnus glutinosa]